MYEQSTSQTDSDPQRLPASADFKLPGGRVDCRLAEAALAALAWHLDHHVDADAWLERAGRLLSRAGGDDAVLPETPKLNDLISRARSASKIAAELGASLPTHPTIALADGVARALGLADVDGRLLRIAFMASVCKELSYSINFCGDVSLDYCSRFFAALVELPIHEVADALERPNVFRDSPSVPFPVETTPLSHLRLPYQVQALIRRGIESPESVLRIFFREAPKADVSWSDFAGYGAMAEVLECFGRHALESPRVGVNVLLHGSPGTGKTQMIRALAERLGVFLAEVAVADNDGDPLTPGQRLRRLQLTQDALAKHSSAFVVFDEVEDVFPAVHELSHSTVGVASGERTKGWLTKLLEVNRRPTFWLCNQIHHIDPAYLRRFDLVIEARGPNIDSKRRMVDRLMADVPLGDVEREEIAHEPCMSVGHLTKLSSALAAMAGSTDRFPLLFRQVIHEWRNSHGERHIRHSGAGRIIRYREDCLNSDVDLSELASALVEAPSARICLYGPSGTGKSEWARYLSDRLGKKLIVKRGSDLLIRYVGETEKRIREAFSVAEHDNALLLIDEAEGLVRDRTGDVPHWQVSMTNEFLTSMEAFEGVCVITTNTIDLIDSAALRRFDFKVELRPLSPSQSKALFLDLLTTLGAEPPSSAELLRVASLRSLTPGDFASVARQNRIMRRHRSASDLLDALAREIQFKSSSTTVSRIGFLRDREINSA